MFLQFHDVLVGNNGLLVQFAASEDNNVQRAAIQCLENVAYRFGFTLCMMLYQFTAYSISVWGKGSCLSAKCFLKQGITR